LTQLEAEYKAARAPLVAEFRSKDESREAESEKKIQDLHLQFMPNYLRILSHRMHAWTNVGQQSANPGQQLPNPSQEPLKAGQQPVNASLSNQ
jgi:hypothetical protein